MTSRVVDVPGPTMMHDLNLTERFVVFMDLPRCSTSIGPWPGPCPTPSTRPTAPVWGAAARRPHGEVRWFDVEPCYVPRANAHDDGETITIDVVRHEGWARWAARALALDDRPGCRHGGRGPAGRSLLRVPRADDRLTGRPARQGWVTCAPHDHRPDEGGSLVVHDLVGGGTIEHHFGPGRVPGEAVLAPADDQAGGQAGW